MLEWLIKELSEIAERHNLSVYNKDRKFDDGIFWVRQRYNGWGLWIKDHKNSSKFYSRDYPDAPGEDSFILVRIGNISVAVIMPLKDRGQYA